MDESNNKFVESYMFIVCDGEKEVDEDGNITNILELEYMEKDAE